jgi:hypothetical protein
VRQVKQASVIGEIVEIAARRFTRLGSARQIIARNLRRRVRQEARLNLGGHAQTFLHPALFHARLKQPAVSILAPERAICRGSTQFLRVAEPTQIWPGFCLLCFLWLLRCRFRLSRETRNSSSRMG